MILSDSSGVDESLLAILTDRLSGLPDSQTLIPFFVSQGTV